MGSKNVGVLLHKLTKYQTLLANSHEHSKMSTYRQKINQYTSKLENLGVDRSTLTQIGGLAGGVDYEKVLQDLIKIQTAKLQTRIGNLKTGISTNPQEISDIQTNIKDLLKYKQNIDSNVQAAETKIDTLVAEASDRVDKGIKAYAGTIETLVKLIRTLLGELINLEKELDTMNVPTGINLDEIKKAITDVNSALSTFSINSDLGKNIGNIGNNKPDITNEIASTYAKLLIEDIIKDSNYEYVNSSGKHTPRLSVELRQLVSLMGLTGTEVDFENTLKQQFSNNSATDLGKITDLTKKKALEILIEGDGKIPSFKQKLTTKNP